MRATIMHKAHDVRIENVPDAAIQEPTDALIRVTRACICGSDLWPYNGGPNVEGQRWVMRRSASSRMSAASVRTIKRGQVVDHALRRIPTARCLFCEEGLPAACVHRGFFGNGRSRRRAGRSAAHPAGRRHALPDRVGEDDALMPVAADPVGRDGHRPPCGGDRRASGPAARSPWSATARSACAG